MPSSRHLIPLLHKAGLRATPGRVALLAVLTRAREPLSVTEIRQNSKAKLDEATVYRALESFVKSRLIRRIDLNPDRAQYEFVPSGEHHHHLLCRICRLVEEIEVPHARAPELDALKASKKFRTISNYSLDFFGVCKACS